MLAPGGYLCIGHAESLHTVAAPIQPVGGTIYRKNGGEPHGG
jgi:chemotaxis methyl-accepting protein methylase